jgi:acylphosphatase
MRGMSTSGDGRAAVEIHVAGRVQGVGFREFARACAERLGLVGYAMNLRDGRVRVVAEGRREALEALLREVERGPRVARVDDVQVSWAAARGEFSGFGIRYAGRDA